MTFKQFVKKWILPPGYVSLMEKIILRFRYPYAVYSQKLQILFKKSVNVRLETIEVCQEFNEVISMNSDEIKKNGGREFSLNGFLQYKTSDTLFVLGSGNSINDIKSEEWEEIEKCDSVGFNWFMAHEFIPTFYHMEFTRENFEIAKQCYSQKPNEFKRIPFLVNYKHVDRSRPLSDYVISPNTLFSNPRSFNQHKENLERILRYSYFYSDYRQENFYIHYRASLSIFLSLGVLLGYKNIVLMGVDLNDNQYFFFDEDRYNSTPAQTAREFIKKMTYDQKISGKLKIVHPTNDNTIYTDTYTIEEFIDIYTKTVSSPLGIKLYIGSQKSALYPTLDYYDFSLK